MELIALQRQTQIGWRLGMYWSVFVDGNLKSYQSTELSQAVSFFDENA